VLKPTVKINLAAISRHLDNAIAEEEIKKMIESVVDFI